MTVTLPRRNEEGSADVGCSTIRSTPSRQPRQVMTPCIWWFFWAVDGTQSYRATINGRHSPPPASRWDS